MVAWNRPCWSYIWDSEACVCMVGLLVRMSLSGLHSCVYVLRLVILNGGCIYFFIFGLGIVKVVGICLSSVLFLGVVVMSCY